jgi:HEAT repeat protein
MRRGPHYVTECRSARSANDRSRATRFSFSLTAIARTSDAEHETVYALHPRRPLSVLFFVASLALAADPARAQAPQIDDVEDSLLHDPSYKVRVDAALVLGKLHQQRSVPALAVATKDGHPAVRASAVRALGLIAAPSARDAIVAALHDPVPSVRRMAREALRSLGEVEDGAPRETSEPGIHRRPAKLSIAVKPVGDPQHQAGPVLRSHMRDFLVEQLRPLGTVSPDEDHATYAIDGVIKHLVVSRGGPDVEVICAVQLIVMRQPGNALFLLTSGEGRVQKPRRQFRPQLQASMELQAVEVAVRGASEDLISQLAP